MDVCNLLQSALVACQRAARFSGDGVDEPPLGAIMNCLAVSQSHLGRGLREAETAMDFVELSMFLLGSIDCPQAASSISEAHTHLMEAKARLQHPASSGASTER